MYIAGGWIYSLSSRPLLILQPRCVVLAIPGLATRSVRTPAVFLLVSGLSNLGLPWKWGLAMELYIAERGETLMLGAGNTTNAQPTWPLRFLP